MLDLPRLKRDIMPDVVLIDWRLPTQYVGPGPDA